jgi:hypothetical protein
MTTKNKIFVSSPPPLCAPMTSKHILKSRFKICVNNIRLTFDSHVTFHLDNFENLAASSIFCSLEAAKYFQMWNYSKEIAYLFVLLLVILIRFIQCTSG